MGTDLVRQMTRYRQPLRLAGIAAIVLILIPGMPKLPFLLAGGVLLFASPATPATRSRPTRRRRRSRGRPPTPRGAGGGDPSTRSSSSSPRT